MPEDSQEVQFPVNASSGAPLEEEDMDDFRRVTELIKLFRRPKKGARR